MTRLGGNQLRAPEEQVERTRDARSLATGHPRRPREYHDGPAWALVAVAVTMFVVGIMLPQGWLLAAGLVTAGVAAYLFSPPRDPDGYHKHPYRHIK